jgi:hypothetical protein
VNFKNIQLKIRNRLTAVHEHLVDYNWYPTIGWSLSAVTLLHIATVAMNPLVFFLAFVAYLTSCAFFGSSVYHTVVRYTSVNWQRVNREYEKRRYREKVVTGQVV